jgi:hypothetical protein
VRFAMREFGPRPTLGELQRTSAGLRCRGHLVGPEKKSKFQERCLKPLGHAWRLRLTAIGTRASHIGKVETICQPSSLIGDRHRRCALGPLPARVQWSIHLPVQTAHFRHNLNTVEFDSRRYGMGDDAGSGKLDIEAVCAGASLRTALHFSRQLRQ